MPVFDGTLALAFDVLESQAPADPSPRRRLYLAGRPIVLAECDDLAPQRGARPDKYRALELRRRRAQIRARRMLAAAE